MSADVASMPPSHGDSTGPHPTPPPVTNEDLQAQIAELRARITKIEMRLTGAVLAGIILAQVVSRLVGPYLTQLFGQ